MKMSLQIILKALKATVNFATSIDWQPVTSSLPALDTRVQNLQNRITVIDGLIAIQVAPITGFTQQKHNLKEDAVIKSITNIRPVMSYAKQNDAVLYDLLTGTPSVSSKTSIRRLTDIVICPRLTDVRTAIDANLTAINAAGVTSVTSATMLAMQNAINLYAAYLSIPRNKVASRKATTETIETMITDANAYARTVLDPLVESFLVTNNDYYKEWFINRRQVNNPIHHNRIHAHLINDLGQPFGPGITVTVDEYTDPDTGNTYHAVWGFTDINGIAIVEEFFPGDRTVTVSGDDVVTKTFGPFHFESGNGIVQVFTCQPAFDNIPAPKTQEETEKVTK